MIAPRLRDESSRLASVEIRRCTTRDVSKALMLSKRSGLTRIENR